METLNVRQEISERANTLMKDLVNNFICRERDLYCTAHNGNALIMWSHDSYNDASVDYEIEVFADRYVVRWTYLFNRNYKLFKEEYEVIDFLTEEA